MHIIENILIPKLNEKPEFDNFNTVLSQFMKDNDIKTVSKALPRFVSHYQFVEAQRDAWQEKHNNLSRESRELVKELRAKVEEQEKQINAVKEVFKLFKINDDGE